MKSAKEIASEFCYGPPRFTENNLEAIIKDVQRDALEHAADIADSLMTGVVMGHEVLLAPGNAIRAEAEKLK